MLKSSHTVYVMRHCRTLNLSLKDVQVLFVCLYLFSVSNTLFADFRLVVICADEDHGRSFCASRLSAYQRKIHPLPLVQRNHDLRPHNWHMKAIKGIFAIVRLLVPCRVNNDIVSSNVRTMYRYTKILAVFQTCSNLLIFLPIPGRVE